MKRLFRSIVALALAASCYDAAQAGYPHAHGFGARHCNNCNDCNGCGLFGLFGGLGLGGYRFADGGAGPGSGFIGHHYPPPGPPTPTVVYPYYTTRGPRDFLSPNPRGIGP